MNDIEKIIIEARNVNKHFGKFKALHNLNLQVKKGEVHGFLGPNGAGKSTTIRLLLGLIKADSGSIKLFGSDPWKDAAQLHKNLAYVPGDVSLWPDITGGEAIDILAKLRDNFDEDRRKRLIERFELDPTKKSRTYSKGNRQKVAIIAALCSSVDLYIFDEPTSGLDPLMEAVFQDEILAEKKQGKTVLLSSHIMSEVEALADRVSIIRSGSIMQTGKLSDLRKYTHTTIHATVTKITNEINNFQSGTGLRIEGDTINGRIETSKLDEFIKLLSAAGIKTFTSEPPSLEELFVQFYEKSK